MLFFLIVGYTTAVADGILLTLEVLVVQEKTPSLRDHPLEVLFLGVDTWHRNICIPYVYCGNLRCLPSKLV